MKKLLCLIALILVGCPPAPPNPKPNPPPSADAAPAPVPTPPLPPGPVPKPTADAAPPPAPSDQYSVACANMVSVGCGDVDPKTCAASLKKSLEQHITPSLTQTAVTCLGVAPTKAGVRACTAFEKCP